MVFDDPRTTLACARILLRTAKRRLRKGHTVRGFVTLYEAVLFGMHFYIATHKQLEDLQDQVDPWDGMSLFHALTRAGVFENSVVFHHLTWAVERALWQGSFCLDTEMVLGEGEEILRKLGVLAAKRTAPPGNADLSAPSRRKEGEAYWETH